MFIPKQKGAISQRNLSNNIADIIRNRLSLNNSIQIMVNEVECRDEGCVPIEVLIILIGPNNRWIGKILKPMVDVTPEDIYDLKLPDNLESDKIPVATDFSLDSRLLSSVDNSLSSSKFDSSYDKTESRLSPRDDDTTTIIQMRKIDSHNTSSLTPSAPALDTDTRTMIKQSRPPTYNEIDIIAKPRHIKGTRPRGCPCCDPDNIDNIIDQIIFNNTPP